MSPIPPGYVRRSTCGEFNGSTQAKHIIRAVPEDPENLVTVTCICRGISCRYCHTNLIRRPLTNNYDEAAARVWHTPHFGCLIPCDDCKSHRLEG